MNLSMLTREEAAMLVDLYTRGKKPPWKIRNWIAKQEKALASGNVSLATQYSVNIDTMMRKWLREELLEVRHMPPELVGLTNNAAKRGSQDDRQDGDLLRQAVPPRQV